jgi:hypothetical protein
MVDTLRSERRRSVIQASRMNAGIARAVKSDMEEHGRHCKSWEVHHRQRYCVSRCVSRVNYFFSL